MKARLITGWFILIHPIILPNRQPIIYILIKGSTNKRPSIDWWTLNCEKKRKSWICSYKDTWKKSLKLLKEFSSTRSPSASSKTKDTSQSTSALIKYSSKNKKKSIYFSSNDKKKLTKKNHYLPSSQISISAQQAVLLDDPLGSFLVTCMIGWIKRIEILKSVIFSRYHKKWRNLHSYL